MKIKTFRIDEDQEERLLQIAKKYGWSFGQLLREIIKKYLEKAK